MTSILWLRQDLRLLDHPALVAAVAEGAVLPVFILDDVTPGDRRMGGAQRWWLHHSLTRLGEAFTEKGAALILRRGEAASALQALCAETGIKRIHATWQIHVVLAQVLSALGRVVAHRL